MGPREFARSASPQPGAQPSGQIEAAEPLAAPTRSKGHQLGCRTLRGGPLQLVRLVPPQEIEPAVAELDRAADHHAHQNDPYALVLPAWIAAALVEIHG